MSDHRNTRWSRPNLGHRRRGKMGLYRTSRVWWGVTHSWCQERYTSSWWSILGQLYSLEVKTLLHVTACYCMLLHVTACKYEWMVWHGGWNVLIISYLHTNNCWQLICNMYTVNICKLSCVPVQLNSSPRFLGYTNRDQSIWAMMVTAEASTWIWSACCSQVKEP